MQLITKLFLIAFLLPHSILSMNKPDKLQEALNNTPLQFRKAFNTLQSTPAFQVLNNKNPFDVLDSLVDAHQNKKNFWSSLFSVSACKKALAAFQLSRQLNKEIYIPELTAVLSDPTINIDEHLSQFDDLKKETYERERAIINGEYDLKEMKTIIQELKEELEKIKHVCQNRYGITYACLTFKSLSDELEKDHQQTDRALEIINLRHTLYTITHDPLSYLEDENKRKEYNQNIRKLYSLPEVNNTYAQKNNGQTLLHGCCTRNLTLSDFSQLLTFLTYDENDLGINQSNKDGQRLLDYAKQVKLERDYITTIENLGGKTTTKKSLKWSTENGTAPQAQEKVS